MAETAIKLGKWARELYLGLGDELGLGSGFTTTGYYILAETEEEEAAFRGVDRVAAGVRRAERLG